MIRKANRPLNPCSCFSFANFKNEIFSVLYIMHVIALSINAMLMALVFNKKMS